MTSQSEQVLLHYTNAYQKLYNRNPKDLRVIDNEWVIINGARMRVSELEHLTLQLENEYSQTIEEKRSVVMRLLRWFKS